MLKVYKASAGSGKTFRLVTEYLLLLLEAPVNYRHILAVTFTNKATNEMKSRILEQLYILAANRDSGYLDILMKESGHNEAYIRKQAGKALRFILHDYNRFSVSTIDSFTQRIIKSFNRELGISPNFAIELDNDLLLEESVDRLLARIDEDPKLFKWLKEFNREKIQENKSRNLEEDIRNVGKELFKENFQVFFPNDEREDQNPYNKDNLESFQKQLKKICSDFEKKLQQKGEQAVLAMQSLHLAPDDFKGGANRSIGFFFTKLAKGIIPKFTSTVRKHAEDPEEWAAKSSKKRPDIIAAAQQSLLPLLNDIVDFYDNNLRDYTTATEVLKQIRLLGILTDLRNEIKNLANEKGIFMLSNANLLLSKIIGNSDTPFVYEKTGNFYRHFMLDEFQDTSMLQWHNLRPLLQNSLAEGNNNLVVGDVKQSIYRWRNSDWNILAHQLEKDFANYQLREETLDQNWRSNERIILFNNAIIGALKEMFKFYLFRGIDEAEPYKKELDKLYQSFEQKTGSAKQSGKGYVEINFLPEDDFKNAALNQLIDQVKTLQDKGIKARDIAILIRRNRDGAAVIDHFIEAAKQEENAAYNLAVLSSESLFLHKSKAVIFIIHTIKLLIEPESPLVRAALTHLWTSWLKPTLKSMGIPLETREGQTLLDFSTPDLQLLAPDFSDLYENELKARIDRIRQKASVSSLDETIMRIADNFQLFRFEQELPFLQTLIDKAAELKNSLANDLSNFIVWWQTKGYTTSVDVNEEMDAIRMLTIHTSKGLEFKAVLIHFENWSMRGPNNKDILWCDTDAPPFNQFPLLPVQGTKALAQTHFSHHYFTEQTYSYIDTLNVLYVALTRACSVLMINCPKAKEPSPKSKDNDRSLNYILYKSLLQLTQQKEFCQSIDDDGLHFRFGSLPQESDPSSPLPVSVPSISRYEFNDFSNRLQLRSNSQGFIEADKGKTARNTGKIIHEILSSILTADELDKACAQAVTDGKISEEERRELQPVIAQNLQLPEVQEWFNGSMEILNERDLITPKGLYRPDRIMTQGNRAIVVDYKTGDIDPKYKRQVERYAKIIKDCGFEEVSGYLWFLNTNKLEKVCELA